MKLNLLPKAVAKEASLKKSIFVAVVILLAMGAGSFMMVTSSRTAVEEAITRRNNAVPQAAKAVQVSKDADTVLLAANGVNTNIALFESMQKQSDVYPALYDEVRKYIPSFMRVTSMQATPNGASTTVTITGVLKTFQQYADIMLAMVRVPGFQGVNRSNFVHTYAQVQPLSQTNTSSIPRAPGDANVPLNPLERYDYIMQNGPLPDVNAAAKGLAFTGEGGFGSDETGPRGAMPGYSLVTITLVLARDIQAPQVRATVEAASAASTGGGSGGGNGTTTTTNRPANQGGGNRPTQTPPSTDGGTGGKKGSKDEEE